MSTISKTLSTDEVNVSLEDYERVIEDNLTKPLTGEGDVGKLKELAERFPSTDFHLTNKTSGITYKIVYDYTSARAGCPAARWYRDGIGFLWSSQRNFARPCKIVMTSCSGFKKDVTYMFD
jgi:hypothetical protein